MAAGAHAVCDACEREGDQSRDRSALSPPSYLTKCKLKALRGRDYGVVNDDFDDDYEMNVRERAHTHTYVSMNACSLSACLCV